MFILRPSSAFKRAEIQPAPPIKVAQPEAPEPPAEEVSKELFIDRGLPIPASYDIDIIRALLQDPFRIFIYWEVRDESLKSLTRLFTPDEAEAFRVALKLRDIEGRQEVYFDVGRIGRYWMMVFPDREYEFEIGVRSDAYGYIMLIRSNRVRTPRGTVSPETAEEREYRMAPAQFVDVIEVSGFSADQSLSITLAAANGVVHEKDALDSVIRKLPESVRAAMRTAAQGRPLTADMIERLPEPLRSELMKLLLGSDGNIAAVGLMHYLPEMLREVIEDEHEFVGDALHPLHIAPRFFVGGTENVQQPGGELRWPGLARRPGPQQQESGAGRRIRRESGAGR